MHCPGVGFRRLVNVSEEVSHGTLPRGRLGVQKLPNAVVIPVALSQGPAGHIWPYLGTIWAYLAHISVPRGMAYWMTCVGAGPWTTGRHRARGEDQSDLDLYLDLDPATWQARGAKPS